MSVIENAIKRLQASRGGAASAGARERRAAAVGPRGDTAPESTASNRIIPMDLDGLREAGLLAPAHQERELAQQFRHIKRPLINNALGRGVTPLPDGNLVMIASAVPGEGKTFTSLNLALSMRLEEDVTVLLVDGDVVNPRLSQILGADDARGLLDVIKDPSCLARVRHSPDQCAGAYIPAGRTPGPQRHGAAGERTHERGRRAARPSGPRAPGAV